MAIRTIPAPKETELWTTVYAMKYDELLMKSRQQAAQAREMGDKARQMIDHAIEMRARPWRFAVR